MDETNVFQPQAQQVQQEPPSEFAKANKSSFSFKTILKLLLGILVVVFASLLIFAFLLPNLGKNKNEKVTLSFWGVLENEDRKALSDFEKQNPGFKVNYKKEDIRGYREKLTARIKSGTGPDVFLFHNTWLPMFADLLVPFPNDVINPQEFKSLPSVAQIDLVKNGAVFGIPGRIDTLSLFVNTGNFEAAGLSVPSNWIDFINTSRALTVKDQSGKIKTGGAAMGTFDNIIHAGDIISLLFIQNGVDLNNMSENLTRASDALNFYTSFAMGEGSVWDQTLDSSILAFSKGSLAMFFAYSSDQVLIKESSPDLKFDMVSVPQLPNQNITIANYYAYGVSIKSKHQKEALALLKFFYQRNKDDITAQSEKNATSSFFADGTFDNGLNEKANSLLRNAVSSILNNNTSPETAAQTLSQGISQVLSQY